MVAIYGLPKSPVSDWLRGVDLGIKDGFALSQPSIRAHRAPAVLMPKVILPDRRARAYEQIRSIPAAEIVH
jgi:hypothetical protein